jgi:trehalose 6-phosphate phosphatase
VVDLLDHLRAEPRAAAIVLDVDGVLAPIVARPEDSVVPDETREVLRGLVRRYGLVAAVSGRTTADATRLVGVPQIQVAGTHGLELESISPEWVEAMHRAADGVRWRVEDKGVTLAIHYRDADDPDAARAELETVAARARSAGLHARFGRKVLELLPPVDANKGTAVRRLLERSGLSRALYAGDDTTDLDAFSAVAGLELGVRVAVSSPEAPPELLSSADLVVGSTGDLLELLRRL